MFSRVRCQMGDETRKSRSCERTVEDCAKFKEIAKTWKHQECETLCGRRMTEPEARHTNGAKQLFQDEVQVLATLEHPNITRWDTSFSLACTCTSVLITTRLKRGGQLECGFGQHSSYLRLAPWATFPGRRDLSHESPVNV